MGMTRILIIRHGLSQGNLDKVICGHFDTTLTDAGREQANKTGRHLAGKKIDKIYSSDLQRAYETASIIASQLNMDVEKEPRLRERSCGIFEGQPVEKVLKHPQWDGFISKPHVNVEGGETIGMVYQRAKVLLADIVKKHESQTVILVTHGGWLWASVPVALGIKIDDYFGFIGMDNCSITTVVWDQGTYILENLNQTSHLGEIMPESLSWRF